MSKNKCHGLTARCNEMMKDLARLLISRLTCGAARLGPLFPTQSPHTSRRGVESLAGYQGRGRR